MRSKKILAVVIINAAVILTFGATQNCGRVNIAAPVELEKASLALSVSSELVVQVKTNSSEIFAVPTASGSADIAALSLDPNSPLLETMTDLRGSVVINPETWNITYKPSVGLIGNDRTTLYVTGSDQKQLAISVAFIVGNDINEGSEELNALVYGNAAEDRIYLQNKLAGYAPPGMSEIFAKWGRFSGKEWYKDAKDIVTDPNLKFCNSGIDATTGFFNLAIDPAKPKIESGKLVTDNKRCLDATFAKSYCANPSTDSRCVGSAPLVASSWSLKKDPDRIFCGTNAGQLTGFVSPNNFEYYRHEANLTSANADDDTIGIVMAYVRDSSGNNHVLAAVRTQGGNRPSVEGWGVVYYLNGAVQKVVSAKKVGSVPTNQNIAYKKNADGSYYIDPTTKAKVQTSGTGDYGGWSNRMSKVQVIRQGSVFTAKASQWETYESSLVLDDSSLLTVDVSDAKNGLEIFKGARPYGYLSYSQLGSEYRGVVFSTGAAETYVYDLVNKIVYEKQSSGVYKARTDLDAFTHIGAPRKVGNPDTGKIFQLYADKTFKLLD